jgi:hypothetical protein
MSFLCAVYSRLAYMPPDQFLSHYTKIFGPIIDENLLDDINTMVQKKGLGGLSDEVTMFARAYKSNVSSKTFLDTVKSGINPVSVAFLPWAEQINTVNGEERISATDANCETQKTPVSDPHLNFVTIDTSNYGSVFIFGDQRAPNIINVVFRGTSNKKSASSYLNPKSWSPTTIATFKNGKNGKEYPLKVMMGVYKLLNEMTNTIMNAVVQVSQWLNPKADPGSLKILTTGHSLGGALATLFAFKYVIQISADAGFKAKYPMLDPSIACFSLGSPRVLGENASVFFCLLTTQNSTLKLSTGLEDRKGAIPATIKGRITYIRSTTLHDPIPALPKAGYEHPCSKGSGPLSSLKGVYPDETARQNINQDCLLMAKNSFSTRCGLLKNLAPRLTTKYTLDLNCKRKKRSLLENLNGPLYSHNPGVFHSQYLGIAYAAAVNLKGSSGKIARIDKDLLTTQPGIYCPPGIPIKKGETVLRLMFYKAGTDTMSIVFTDLVVFRDGTINRSIQDTNEDYSADLDNSNFGSAIISDNVATLKLPEDSKLNSDVFKQLTKNTRALPLHTPSLKSLKSLNIVDYQTLKNL